MITFGKIVGSIVDFLVFTYSQIPIETEPRMKLYNLAESTKKLNPSFWDDDKLRPEILKRLLAIAHDFAEEHNLAQNAVSDLTFTGSLANYTWTSKSDIDLHLVVDLSKIDGERDLLTDYYKTAKSLWNSEHDITICGHAVEIYVQNQDEPHFANGVYSLKTNEWLTKPTEHHGPDLDRREIERKYDSFVDSINMLMSLLRRSAYARAGENAEKLSDKLKSVRQIALKKDGELSLGNIVYKLLRNRGKLDELSRIKQLAYDLSMSKADCVSVASN